MAPTTRILGGNEQQGYGLETKTCQLGSLRSPSHAQATALGPIQFVSSVMFQAALAQW